MNHYGSIRKIPVLEDGRDIRGAAVFDADGRKVGEIRDLLIDHSDGEIVYAVIDADKARLIALPARQLRLRGNAEDESQEEELVTSLRFDQIENLPAFDSSRLDNPENWQHYDNLCRTESEAGPRSGEPESILGGADNVVKADAPLHTPEGDSVFSQADLREILNPAPGRSHLQQPAPSPESRNTLLQRLGRRWTAFQEHLRGRRPEIVGECRICSGEKESGGKAA